LLRFIGRRLLHLLVVLLLVTLFTSYLLDLTPGDPALAIIGETATPDQIAIVHKQLGLDRPFLARYASWIGKAAQGDLGTSFRTKQPVWQAIHERLPITLELAALTIFFSLIIAIPLGVITAYKQGTKIDKGIATHIRFLLLASVPHRPGVRVLPRRDPPHLPGHGLDTVIPEHRAEPPSRVLTGCIAGRR